LVPVSLPAGAAREKARAAVSRRIGDHLRGAVDHLLGTPLVTVISQRSSELPPFPADYQRHLGVAPELIGAFGSAPELIAIRAVYHPGWPPLHEFTARASAAALAADLGAPVLDTFVPRLLSAEAALATLPGADQFKLADWVLVFSRRESAASGAPPAGWAGSGWPSCRSAMLRRSLPGPPSACSPAWPRACSACGWRRCAKGTGQLSSRFRQRVTSRLVPARLTTFVTSY
jgi:hypothetical protein